jgi:hypothetical protein
MQRVHELQARMALRKVRFSQAVAVMTKPTPPRRCLMCWRPILMPAFAQRYCTAPRCRRLVAEWERKLLDTVEIAPRLYKPYKPRKRKVATRASAP